MMRFCLVIGSLCLGWLGCSSPATNESAQEQKSTARRMVSISGSLTEILCEAGMTEQIVGIDVTSTYPDSIQSLPRIGYTRNIPVEGVVSLAPDLIVGRAGDMKPETLDQLRSLEIPMWLFEQVYTVEGTKTLIRHVCDSLNQPETATRLISTVEQELAQIQPIPVPPKVLFVYARGAGSLSVAGNGTQVQYIIDLAGGKNVALDFEGFKPLSTEVLVQANPDVILLFDSGLNSLAGAEGLLNVPGIRATTAGQQGNFISMEGQLLTGFGPRLGQAAAELNRLLISITTAPTASR
ncbi:MAG: helical backbone metal receptor [Bacteroidota bacterium]